jgi:hypothetical protein
LIPWDLRFCIATIGPVGPTLRLRTILAFPYAIFVQAGHSPFAYSTASLGQDLLCDTQSSTSPECALLEAVDRASDTWELGVSAKS